MSQGSLRKQAERQGLKVSGEKDELISRLVKEEQRKGKSKYLAVTNGEQEGEEEVDDDDDNSNDDNNDNDYNYKQKKKKKKKKTKLSTCNNISPSDLPSNLHSLSYSQLRSIIASHGLLDELDETATSKIDLLNYLERKSEGERGIYLYLYLFICIGLLYLHRYLSTSIYLYVYI